MSQNAELRSRTRRVFRFLFFGLAVLPTAAAQDFFTQARGHLDFVRGANNPLAINGFALGDVDGDGDGDLAVARDQNTVLLCRNEDGVFAGCTPLPGPRSATVVAFGDVDGDRDLDLVIGPGSPTLYSAAAPVILLLGDGAGRFVRAAATRMPPVALDTRALLFDDADGDGDIDLLVVASAGSSGPWLYVNDGKGSFQAAAASRMPARGGAERAWLVDIDKDGDRDLVLRRRGGSTLLTNHRGSFTDSSSWLPPREPLRAVGDADGDGDVDLVSDGALLVGDGSGRNWRSFRVTLPPPDAWSTLADIDGDRRADLVGIAKDSVPFVYLGSGRAFQDVSARWIPEHVRAARRPGVVQFPVGLLADADGDGAQDLIIGGVQTRPNTSFTVGIPPKKLVGSGGKRLVDGSRRSIRLRQWSTSALATGDVDGDGDTDAVLVRQKDQLLVNRGDGVFSPRSLSLTSNGYQCAAAALVDVDGDGDPDLVRAMGWHYETVYARLANELYRNDGRGGFTRATSFPAAADGSSSLAYGDVDGDGDIDLVFGNNIVRHPERGQQNRLYLNDGKGRFTDATAGRLPALTDPTTGVALGDVDGDRDLDLVVSNNTAGVGVLLYLNDGKGRFKEAWKRLGQPASARCLALGDVDGDGDLDIVVPGTTFLGDGSGAFRATNNRVSYGTRRLLLADVDADGKAEVIAGQIHGLQIGGAFHRVGWELGHYAFAATDLDQDGDPDVIAAPMELQSSAQNGSYGPVVLFNGMRHLRAAALLRSGRDYRLGFRAGSAAPSVALPLIGAPIAGRRLPVAGLGRLGVRIDTLVTLPPVVIPDGKTEPVLRFRIPSAPPFVGVALASQAVFVSAVTGPRLSNVVIDRVIR